jgi:MHS family proline/betaine transporter-like MFS transporter
MPRYDSIGLLAPLGILAARVVQGFSTGGEFGGATAFMLEHGKGRRGFMASFQFTSQVVSTLAASTVAWLTSVMMSAHTLHDWGFRIPFALGLLIGPVGLYLRRHTEETPVFQHSSHTARPALTVVRHYPLRVLLGAGTIAAGTAATYIFIYLPTYAQTVLHMNASNSYLLPMLGTAISLVVTPTSAAWSDRIGRLVPCIIGVTLMLVLAYPSFLVIATLPGFITVALAAALIAGVRSFYTAPLPALFGELFPPAVRGVGMSVSYSMGILLFGSLTPFANTWAIKTTGLKSFPGLWLVGMSLISLASLLAIRRAYKLEEDT